MAGILDWVSVMTYDFHSGGTRTGFNSALYNHDDPSSPRLNLHDAMQAIAAKGMPKDKLVAGVPFYGRGWQGVESPDAWSTRHRHAARRRLQDVIAETFLKTPGYVRHWDDVAKVPWLYNATKKEWITYRGSPVDAPQGRVHRRAETGRRDVLGVVERRRHAARCVEGWPRAWCASFSAVARPNGTNTR